MKTNQWIPLSQRFYRQLLRLYPQAYRTTYESEMFRLFTDQCKEACKQHGRLAILSFWLRTLADVSVTVVREHLSVPQAKVGLLDATPDTPLPWKGVLLILIPGLIFFVSQIEQVTSSGDWYFVVMYRAGYFLILPVLLIWLLTRRFPVWGLIPLGLLYKILGSYNPHYFISRVPFLRDTLDTSYSFEPTVDPAYIIPIAACVVLLGTLIWYNVRHRQIPQTAWKWLAFCGLLIVFQIAGEVYRMIAQEVVWQGVDWRTVINTDYVQFSLIQMPLWHLYHSLPFLLLIFIGALFARQYGGLSFLLLLGYLLPTVIFGRYDPQQEVTPFYLISLAVLVYRFMVALIAPVWLVRAASIPGQQRAAAIPVAIAILCHISLNVIVYLTWTSKYNLQTNLLDFVLSIWGQLIVAAGLGLAVALYIPREQATIPPSALAVTA